jgi:LEA14-like dessication related protein
MAVENPNSFDLALQGYTFDFQVMALPFSHGDSQIKFVFPAGKQSHVRLPMRVSYGDLIKVIKRHPDLDKIPCQLDASLDIETPVGKLLIPVKKSDVISVPESYRPSTYLRHFMPHLMELR